MTKSGPKRLNISNGSSEGGIQRINEDEDEDDMQSELSMLFNDESNNDYDSPQQISAKSSELTEAGYDTMLLNEDQCTEIELLTKMVNRWVLQG